MKRTGSNLTTKDKSSKVPSEVVEQNPFSRQVLAAINAVRKNPHTIVRSLQE